MINGYNPLVGFTAVVSDYMIPKMSENASMLILVTLAGGMVAMLRETGAAQAFAKLVTRKINTPKKGQIVTCLSAFIFCYTEPCLILGTIMRPVTDTVRVSRAKLSYILDSMGCNLASLSPISSYGPFITGLIATQLAAAGLTPQQPLGNHQQASLLRLDVGTGYQYWYGLPNFYTITRYNHSTHYAMAVWQLGQAVALARVQ